MTYLSYHLKWTPGSFFLQSGQHKVKKIIVNSFLYSFFDNLSLGTGAGCKYECKEMQEDLLVIGKK